MKKTLIIIAFSIILVAVVVIFGVIGVYKTENGIVLGLPDYEKRDLRVSQVDLDILLKADALLFDAKQWRKEPLSACSQSQRLDLYCALEAASVEVVGTYVHRQPALQEVRFVIDDHYRKRWTKHRLSDFNAHKDTDFNDVKSVLSQAATTVRQKLARYRAEP